MGPRWKQQGEENVQQVLVVEVELQIAWTDVENALGKF